MTASKSSAEAEPLGLTVHEMPVPDLEAQRRTVRGRWKMLAVLAMCAAPVVASYFTYFVIRPEGRTNYGELVTPPRALPADLRLVDLQGRDVPPASLLDQWSMVVVAPSACDAACEQRLLLQRQVREALGREKDRVDKVWFVLDDGPLRAPLRQAIEAEPAVRTLRVTPEALGRWLQPAAVGGSAGSIDDHVYLVDPMGNFMLRWPVGADPARLKRDLERVLRASAFWDLPGRPDPAR
jgi:cytochrome oxidase Cu insertion factor (SCO1/SenC/PrrC family)